MVARPPMILRIEPMRVDDLPAVHAIEQASFDAPWPPEAYRNDLETNRLAQYLVARIGRDLLPVTRHGHRRFQFWNRQHGDLLVVAGADADALEDPRVEARKLRAHGVAARRQA